MPAGKVKWFNADKGFGFLADDDGADVFVRVAQSAQQGGQGSPAANGVKT